MSLSKPSRRQLDERGAVTLEMAAFTLAGLLFLLAGTDLALQLRSKLRLDQVSGGMASYVTAQPKLYKGDFPVFFEAAQHMAGSVPVTGAGGAVIITGIVNSSNGPTVAWRESTGNSTITSSLGAVGGPPTNLPDGYVLPVGSSLVAVEAFTQVQTLLLDANTLGGPTLRSISLFQPRGQTLSQISADSRP